MYPACPFHLKSNMQTKVYRTKLSYLSILLKVKKSTLRVVFSGGDMTGGGVFTTADVNVQKALEQSSRFLTGEISVIAIYGEPDIEPEKVIEKESEKIPQDTAPLDNAKKIYPVELNTVQKCMRALMQDYGVTARESETKAKLLLKAQELNVEFPGLQ